MLLKRNVNVSAWKIENLFKSKSKSRIWEIFRLRNAQTVSRKIQFTWVVSEGLSNSGFNGWMAGVYKHIPDISLCLAGPGHASLQLKQNQLGTNSRQNWVSAPHSQLHWLCAKTGQDWFMKSMTVTTKQIEKPHISVSNKSRQGRMCHLGVLCTMQRRV